MVRLRAREQRTLPSSIVVILSSGHDFFGDLDGGVDANMDLLRQAWADASIREAVYKRHGERPVHECPWAEIQFGKGQ